MATDTLSLVFMYLYSTASTRVVNSAHATIETFIALTLDTFFPKTLQWEIQTKTFVLIWAENVGKFGNLVLLTEGWFVDPTTLKPSLFVEDGIRKKIRKTIFLWRMVEIFMFHLSLLIVNQVDCFLFSSFFYGNPFSFDPFLLSNTIFQPPRRGGGDWFGVVSCFSKLQWREAPYRGDPNTLYNCSFFFTTIKGRRIGICSLRGGSRRPDKHPWEIPIALVFLNCNDHHPWSTLSRIRTPCTIALLSSPTSKGEQSESAVSEAEGSSPWEIPSPDRPASASKRALRVSLRWASSPARCGAAEASPWAGSTTPRLQCQGCVRKR